jgi:hypothetical protein
MKRQVIQSVMEEQARQELHNDINHMLIAMKSMEHSNAWSDRAAKIGMYHERDSKAAYNAPSEVLQP